MTTMQTKKAEDFWYPELYRYYPDYYDDRILYESPELSNERLKKLSEEIDGRREALMRQCQTDEQRMAVSDWAQDCRTMHIALIIYRNNASFARASQDERAFVAYRNAYEQAIGIFLPFFEQELEQIQAAGKATAKTEQVAEPLPQHLSAFMDEKTWLRFEEVLKGEGILSAEGQFVRSRDWKYADFFALIQELMRKYELWKRLSLNHQFAILQNTFGEVGSKRNYSVVPRLSEAQQARIKGLIKRILS
jgi:hypothetical protein